MNVTESPSGECIMMYECPCSCRQQFTRDELSAHLDTLAQHSLARHKRTYERMGMQLPAAAHREIWETYETFYEQTLAGQTPDWRNSDGLAGYAASVVRYVTEENA